MALQQEEVFPLDDFLDDAGGVALGAGAALGGAGMVTGATTGWTGIGGIAGAAMAGAGAGLAAAGAGFKGAGFVVRYIFADPPRSNYRTPAYCGTASIAELDEMAYAMCGGAIDPDCSVGVAAADAMLVATANHLAAIEYREGARIDGSEAHVKRFDADVSTTSRVMAEALRSGTRHVFGMHTRVRSKLEVAGVTLGDLQRVIDENPETVSSAMAGMQLVWADHLRRRCSDLPWLDALKVGGRVRTNGVADLFADQSDTLRRIDAAADSMVR